MKDKFAARIKKVLLKHGAGETHRLEEAFAAAEKADATSLAEFLLQREFLDETSLLSAMAQETNFPPIDLDKVSPAKDALDSLNPELATYYCVLPVARLGNLLTLAVGNPFDILKLDDVRTLTNCDLRTVVSTERTIRRNIARAYHGEENGGEGGGELVTETGSDAAQAAEAALAEMNPEELPDVDMEIKKDVEEVVDLSKAQAEASNSPVIKIVNNLIIKALSEKASDIHIEPFEKVIKVRLRMDGVLRETHNPPRSLLNSIISRIKIMSNLDIAERRVPQDGKFQVKFEGRQVDFRVSILPTIHGEKAVLRVLDSSSLNLGISQLGFEKEAEMAFRRALSASYGMLLVTGPTGSGKTTTLYAAISEINNGQDKIITIEDPVEYQLPGVLQIPVNEKKGLTFAVGLRSILRHDPDKIMVGEIRDSDTANIAVQSALTGHQVFTTVHANNVFDVIGRFMHMQVDLYSFISALNGILAQRLLRLNCPHCAEPYIPDDVLLSESGLTREAVSGFKFRMGRGCGQCRGTGYRGRKAIAETLTLTDELRELITAREPIRRIKDAARRNGTRFLRETAVDAVRLGETTLQEINRVTFVA